MIIWELPNMESGIFLHQNRDANHEDKHWKCKFGNILDSVDVSLFVSTNEQWDEQACPEHPSIEWRIFLLWFLCTSYVKCETTKSKPIMCDNDTCFSRKLCCWAAVPHLQCLHITMPMPPIICIHILYTTMHCIYCNAVHLPLCMMHSIHRNNALNMSNLSCCILRCTDYISHGEKYWNRMPWKAMRSMCVIVKSANWWWWVCC